MQTLAHVRLATSATCSARESFRHDPPTGLGPIKYLVFMNISIVKWRLLGHVPLTYALLGEHRGTKKNVWLPTSIDDRNYCAVLACGGVDFSGDHFLALGASLL
jgi:hypothetical protein